MITNEKIKLALEELGKPVFYGIVFEDEVNDFNYFLYGEASIKKIDCKYYQDIEIIYVSENISNLNFYEIDIIEKMESIGLKFKGDGAYDRIQKSKTNAWVDTLTLTFSRPIRKNNESSI
ncbi:MAG: hypothetical protein PHG03_00240 [Bacilli bacterium]|nr:hypothetical protein [Bacilli bacterium]